jgi:zinc/manganese transport system permease protein
MLSAGYLVLLALTAAEVSQITGTLLVFALLVAPAAAAQHLSARPVVSLLVAVGTGLAITWTALFLGYFTAYPIGFDLTSLGLATYLVARVVG